MIAEDLLDDASGLFDPISSSVKSDMEDRIFLDRLENGDFNFLSDQTPINMFRLICASYNRRNAMLAVNYFFNKPKKTPL